MANPDRPNGFRPASPIMTPRPYKVASTNSTKFFKGDIVDVLATGYVQPGVAGSTRHLGSTDDVLAASTAGQIIVYDDPDQDYIAQDDAAGTPARADIFENVDHVAGTGNSYTNLSGHELGMASKVETTAGFTLLELIEGPELTTLAATVGDNAVWRVRVMEHILRTGKTIVTA